MLLFTFFNSEKTSEKNLLDFHLSHFTSDDFKYITNENTDKIIWRYLSSFNLLENLNEIDIEDSEKIISIEKATNNGNYLEKDLLNLYTRYRFSINQLITVLESYKMLPGYESRALLYQGFLISKDTKSKIELLKILKEQFDKDDIENILTNINKKAQDKITVFHNVANFNGEISPCLALDPSSPRY